MRTRFFVLVACASALASGQAPSKGASSVEVQKAAMRKLAFLVGKWSGPATIARGPGDALTLTQTEDVQMKLDGLVMTIEGTSRDETGKVRFQAFATVAYDDATKTYRFRAYNDGHYLDTELTVAERGFTWSMDQGPAHIVNTMAVSAAGEWSETTGVKVGAAPLRATVSMTLKKVS